MSICFRISNISIRFFFGSRNLIGAFQCHSYWKNIAKDSFLLNNYTIEKPKEDADKMYIGLKKTKGENAPKGASAVDFAEILKFQKYY